MLRCPVCGSKEIYQVVGGYIGQIYRCKNCRYKGSLVIETDEEEPATGSRD